MSYDIDLKERGKFCRVSHHSEGGTYAAGGTDAASLNVTYNYAEVVGPLGFSFNDSLHGKTARDTLVPLAAIVAECGIEQDDDYWKPTPGNAGYAASILLRWASMYPDAVWSVS